jgi:uncharacterized protein YunC (DUF1805 family)
MLKYKKIKIGKKYIEAICVNLGSKNLILLRGSRGYVMCGYLDLEVAEKFKDVAVKIVGVSTIQQALKAKVHSCTSQARRLGISQGQSVPEVLKIIA